MALTETRPETAPVGAAADGAVAPRTQATAAEKLLGSGDHKVIGRLFIGASLLYSTVFLVVAALTHFYAAGAGLEASVMARFGLNHPIGLMFCGVMPLILGVAIYVVPLQVGAPTVSFPRAAAMSLWAWMLASDLFIVAMLVKGAYGGSSEDMTRLGHVSFGLLIVSLLVGVISVMATVMSGRTAGMTLDRVPFFSFSMLVTGALWLVTLPAALAAITLWHIRRPSPADLSAVPEGAYSAFAWVFSQPAVYIVAIPVLGVLLDVAGALSGQRQKSYGVLQSMIVAFGALSFGAFAVKPDARETLVWVAGAILVALPVLGVFGGALDNLRRGAFKMSAGLAFAILSVLVLLVGVLAGVVRAVSTFGDGNWFEIAVGGVGIEGAGLAVGQFYLVMAAGLMAGLAGTFHWGSRIFAGGLPKAAGMGLAPLALLGGLAFGAGQLIVGLARPDADGVEPLMLVSGIGAVVVALVAFGALGAVASAAFGLGGTGTADESDDSTPDGGTLEWLTASPPVDGNFSEPIATVETPYPVLDLHEGANR